MNDKCDLRKTVTDDVIYDGKTNFKPGDPLSSRWAWMCESCFSERGIGLGVGRGQKFDVQTGKKLEG